MLSSVNAKTVRPQGSILGDKVRSRFSFVLSLLLLIIMSIITLAPIVWAIGTSLRKPTDSFILPPQWIPLNPIWSNYSEVFDTIPYLQYLWNSTFVVVGILIGQLITATLAGYAFARLPFPFKVFLFWIILATLMIPILSTIIPVFVLISQLHLADTHASLIIPAWPTAFGTFLLRQYFMGISNEYEEAAVIDGANQFQVFYRVYLPLAAPGMAILAVLSFNAYWNDFFRPLIFLTSPDKFTLPLGMVSLFGINGTGSISVILAGVLLSLIPVFLVYLVGQRYLVQGITMGGLKG